MSYPNRGPTGWSRGNHPIDTDPGWFAKYQQSIQMSKRKADFDASMEAQAKRRAAALSLQASRAEARAYEMSLARQFAPSRPSPGLQRSTVVRQGSENNFVDVANASYANDTTGSITLLNTVAQGSSVNQRIGKKWMMKSIQCRGYQFNNTTATFNDTACLLVYDKRPTGSLPAITEVLNTVNAASFNNDVNSGRFRIIRRWDKMLLGVASATTGTETSVLQFEEFVKLNLPVVNKGATNGAIGDIEQGALYFITVGSSAPGTANAATQVGFRIRFKDT